MTDGSIVKISMIYKYVFANSLKHMYLVSIMFYIYTQVYGWPSKCSYKSRHAERKDSDRTVKYACRGKHVEKKEK